MPPTFEAIPPMFALDDILAPSKLKELTFAPEILEFSEVEATMPPASRLPNLKLEKSNPEEEHLPLILESLSSPTNPPINAEEIFPIL